MLRNIKVKNFVHFHEDQELSFRKGAYFFIGQNESGKSCMFEAVRRCMSTSKSMGMSSSHDANEWSIVACDFKLSKYRRVKSCLLRIPKKREERIEIDIFVKFVFEVDRETKQRNIFLDLVKEVVGKWAVNKRLNLDLSSDPVKSCLDSLTHERYRLKKKVDFTILQACIEKMISYEELRTFSNEDRTYDENTPCENYLLQNIDTAVLIVYPTRAIATGQWTKSVGFQIETRQDERADVERKISQRSEIMSWYFGLSDDDCTIEDKERVRNIFRTITNNRSFIFKCTGEDKTIKVRENEDGEEHQLIKVPDGYFEAKHCAILFAFEQHKTICIEEAGKGMHPQMIERLRDLVLQKVENKVIITTSHSPSMLSFWNLPRIFFFRKIRHPQNEDRVTFKVIDGETIVSTDEHKTSRMVVTQSFASIFFARRVLYVEGDSDLLFMSILKQELLQSDNIRGELIQKSGISDINNEDVSKFLFSLHIIPLHGHHNKEKFRQVSKKLDLQHFFVLDYDSLEPKQGIQFALDHLEIKNPITEELVKGDVSCLEEEGIFVWQKTKEEEVRKRGTLERALITLADKNETKELRKVFTENNVHLQWDASKETKHLKFGNNKNLTIKNVQLVIQAVLDCCLNGEGVDFARLINFWMENSVQKVPKKNPLKIQP